MVSLLVLIILLVVLLIVGIVVVQAIRDPTGFSFFTNVLRLRFGV